MARSNAATATEDQVAALEEALAAVREHPHRRTPGPRCEFSKVIARLPEQTAEKIVAAVNDMDNTSVELADILNEAGFTITAYTVARHRRRGQSNGCRCPR